MGEGHTEDAQPDESPKEYVTVGETAKLTVWSEIPSVLGAQVHTLDAQRTTVSEELSRMIATRLDEIVRDYMHELGALREELGAERARREMAEATLREGMAEEQRRREEAERERDDLRREPYALREPRESPQTAEEQQGRGQAHSGYGRGSGGHTASLVVA